MARNPLGMRAPILDSLDADLRKSLESLPADLAELGAFAALQIQQVRLLRQLVAANAEPKAA